MVGRTAGVGTPRRRGRPAWSQRPALRARCRRRRLRRHLARRPPVGASAKTSPPSVFTDRLASDRIPEARRDLRRNGAAGVRGPAPKHQGLPHRATDPGRGELGHGTRLLHAIRERRGPGHGQLHGHHGPDPAVGRAGGGSTSIRPGRRMGDSNWIQSTQATRAIRPPLTRARSGSCRSRTRTAPATGSTAAGRTPGTTPRWTPTTGGPGRGRASTAPSTTAAHGFTTGRPSRRSSRSTARITPCGVALALGTPASGTTPLPSPTSPPFRAITRRSPGAALAPSSRDSTPGAPPYSWSSWPRRS